MQTSQTTEDNLISVSVRIRPFLGIENSKAAVQIQNTTPPVLVIEEKDLNYAYDHIFPCTVSQETIFNEMVKPHIAQVFAGRSSTIFAYGQTGTGKTYTIGTDPDRYSGENSGMLSKTLQRMFDHKTDESNKEIRIAVSFIEIYNEKAYDLLSSNTECLAMRGFSLQGVRVQEVQDTAEACELLNAGSRNRHIGETKLNTNSSRSHAIFTIYCNIRDENAEINSKLHLVDLAGSENVKRTGNEGVQFRESVSINKGLFYVGQVISALCGNSVPPYRESVLTKILHDSLTSVNHVALIACISPSIDDISETVATLDFAKKIKKVKNGFNKLLSTSSHSKLYNSISRKRTLPYSSAQKIKRALFNQPMTTPLSNIPINSTRCLPQLPEHSPRSLFNLSIASISTNTDIASISTNTDIASNISPIVKRCTDALEESMMNKLENLLKTQLKSHVPLNVARTPDQWQKFEAKVTQLIRTELKQFVSVQRPVRACSSPKYKHEVRTPPCALKKDFPHQLNFSNIGPVSPVNDEEFHFKIPIETAPSSSEQVAESLKIEETEEMRHTDASLCLANDKEFTFKVPVALAPLVKPKSKASSNVSTKRRSVRLMLEKSVLVSPKYHRRSVRLSQTIKHRQIEKHDINIKGSPKHKKRTTKSKKQHEIDVLNVLNEGDAKELSKLATIGPKTATLIINHRNVIGIFDSISDVSKIPTWKGNRFKRFLEGNYLSA